jgi:hypothetical protein
MGLGAQICGSRLEMLVYCAVPRSDALVAPWKKLLEAAAVARRETHSTRLLPLVRACVGVSVQGFVRPRSE